MKFTTIFLLIAMLSVSAFSQSKFPKNELSINGFRNPSIGAEYRRNHISVHAGYYLTNFESGITTRFLRAGLSYWFLPLGNKENPSAFYGSVSYARGLNRDYEDKNAAVLEAGFKWMVYKGLNVRIGVAALTAKGQGIKINPTPGVSYSFTF